MEKCNKNTSVVDKKKNVSSQIINNKKVNTIDLDVVITKSQVSKDFIDSLKSENIRFKQLISRLTVSISKSNSGRLETKYDTIYQRFPVTDTLLKNSIRFIEKPFRYYTYKDNNLKAKITGTIDSLFLDYTYNTGVINTTIYTRNHGFLGLGKTTYHANISYQDKNAIVTVESNIIKQPKKTILVIGPSINMSWSPLHPTQIVPSVGLGLMIPMIQIKK